MVSALQNFHCHPQAGVFSPAEGSMRAAPCVALFATQYSRVRLASLSKSNSAIPESPLQKVLRVPHELIGIDHAGHTFAFFALSRGIGAHHAPLALDDHILPPPGDVGWQRDLKLHRRPNLQRRVGANVNSRRAQISCSPLGVAAGALFMYLDRQFQRKSFSGPRFGHSASSFVADLRLT